MGANKPISSGFKNEPVGTTYAKGTKIIKHKDGTISLRSANKGTKRAK